MTPIKSDSQDPQGATRRGRVGEDWSQTLGDSLHAGVLYQRRFQRPTGLAKSDTVWLVFDEICGSATLQLNGTDLGSVEESQQSARFELAGLLEKSNLLAVTVKPPQTEETKRGITGEVRLEIHAGGSAYDPAHTPHS